MQVANVVDRSIFRGQRTCPLQRESVAFGHRVGSVGCAHDRGYVGVRRLDRSAIKTVGALKSGARRTETSTAIRLKAPGWSSAKVIVVRVLVGAACSAGLRKLESTGPETRCEETANGSLSITQAADLPPEN